MKFRDKVKLILGKHKSDRLYRRNKPLNVINDFETVDYILKNRCSVCRFGDGELDLMIGISIVFQEKDDKLKQRLLEIAADTSVEVLKCVPNIFMDDSSLKMMFKDEDYLWWRRYIKYTKGYWRAFFKDSIFGDTNISRFYVELKRKDDRDKYVQNLKRIWQNRDIVFIEGEKSRLGVKNDLFKEAKSLKRIICPSKNAFSCYDKILECTKRNCSSDSLIIVALGPTATVLSFDLAKCGYQAIDLGHVDIEYEWYLMKAQKKVPVFNKDANEAGQGTFEESADIDYINQIIAKVEA